ncbi:MAG: hypothetical protein CL462_09485 [Acidimicrobiaceae bacterium]|nr:hypothetical protein [Acidimicrobiaceae bacterium]|tara:strand:+ start:217 stop:630 length:414 start_codon:yes stop_codon:yes gene_type:complete
MVQVTGARSSDPAAPNDGRVFPAKAKGSRPTYFDDEGASDAIVQVVTSLAAEVWALTERIQTLEKVLVEKDLVEDGFIGTYELSEFDEQQRLEDAAVFVGRVFRVLEEMREEIVNDESPEAYLEVVDRAFSELRKES